MPFSSTLRSRFRQKVLIRRVGDVSFRLVWVILSCENFGDTSRIWTFAGRFEPTVDKGVLFIVQYTKLKEGSSIKMPLSTKLRIRLGQKMIKAQN